MAKLVFGAEIQHRGYTIKKLLEARRGIRRNRRNRNTRYRKARFLNRRVVHGWLPPSLCSRMFNVETWVRRLLKLCPITDISYELIKFDMQRMENPEITGVEYQQGALVGYDVREYLLEKYGRKCVYCGAENVPFEVEHVIPKDFGGSDRVSNLVISCQKCNAKKSNKSIEIFLESKPELLAKIKRQLKEPLKDASAVNATRWALYNILKDFGLPIETGSGALTKYNRHKHNLSKEHWLDALCVGASTPDKIDMNNIKPLHIKATGHGSRQMCAVYGSSCNGQKSESGIIKMPGYPRSKAKSVKVCNGFQTGDIVKAIVPNGRSKGTHIGRVAIRANGTFHVSNNEDHDGINWKYCKMLQRANGYSYY